MKLTAIRKGQKQTIFDSGGLDLLQIVLEPDTERCVSEDVDSLKGWIVRAHIGGRH